MEIPLRKWAVRPEDFYFGIELCGTVPIVSICPVLYFNSNKFMDVEDFFEEISDFLEENGFFLILSSSYRSGSSDETVESMSQKIIKLGFKQDPEYDKYILETDINFPNLESSD